MSYNFLLNVLEKLVAITSGNNSSLVFACPHLRNHPGQSHKRSFDASQFWFTLYSLSPSILLLLNLSAAFDIVNHIMRMIHNFLQLKSSKTEAMLIGTPHHVQTSPITSTTFSSYNIPISLNPWCKVWHCKISSYRLRNIAKLHPTLDAKKKTGLLDSALFMGIPGKK